MGLLLSGGMPPAMAQLPWKAYDFFNNAGGLNDGFDPTAIAPTEAAALQNIVFTTGGAIKKRQGYTAISTASLGASAALTGIAFYKNSSGTRFLVGVVNNGSSDTIQQMGYGAGTTGPLGTWTAITGSLAFSITNDHEADFAVAQDTLVIEDGLSTTAPYRWSGSGNAVALGGSPPNASMVEYHKNHLWLAGDNANPSRLYFSNIGDINTWTATDFLNVETNDGSVITGLKSALDCLYVFKGSAGTGRGSIWRVCGTSRDDWTLEQMVRGYGATSNASIELINNQFYFLTDEGLVIRYDGGINVEVISQKIQGTITGLNAARFPYARATAFDSGTGQPDYYLSVSDGSNGTHNLILIYNTFYNAWTKFSGINANALATYEIGTTKTALLFGNYVGGLNRYPNSTSDLGAAISANYMSGQMRFADVPQQKTFRLLRVFANQEGNWNLTVNYRLDFENPGTSGTMSLNGSGALWDTAVFDTDLYADLTTTIGRFEIYRGEDFLQWRVENNNASEPFTVKGVQVWLEPTGRVGGIR